MRTDQQRSHPTSHTTAPATANISTNNQTIQHRAGENAEEPAWRGPARVWGKGPDTAGLICCDDPERLPHAHKEVVLLTSAPAPAPAIPATGGAPQSERLRTWV